MGVAGYGLALIFLYYSAVDLAITQILVETLAVIIFIFILQQFYFQDCLCYYNLNLSTLCLKYSSLPAFSFLQESVVMHRKNL